MPVDTNIIVFTLDDDHDASKFLAYLKDNDIKAVPFGKNTVRFVTHLDVDDAMIERTAEVLQKFRDKS